MSWLRTAVNKAVEVGGRNNITRTVRSYADTVVHHAGQAVAGGAKIIQDSMGVNNYRGFKETVQRLEEIAISSRGTKRTQLMRRWLVDLKEIERECGGSSNDRSLEQQHSEEPRHPPMVFYFDLDEGGESMNFRDVFLHSQALEGIILSMIIEAPTEEEVSLLLDIFGLSMTGGKEVHNAILSSIQDLAKAFSSYQDEVLVKRDELLQFAQGAVTGLKLNADAARIDVEASSLQKKIDDLGVLQSDASFIHKDASGNVAPATIATLKEALAEIGFCSKLESLLLKKKSISTGDSLEIHSQKVDKLKILLESLASSLSKAEKRISDNRHQKEEALNFRLIKDREVGDIEKELSAEISGLEKQRDELEAELKKVNGSLTAAISRLNKTREERDQFDRASNQMVVHLKAKEDDISRSITCCKVESEVVHTWINFLEDTWLLQSTYSEQKEKQMIDDLEKYGKYFVKLTNHHLFPCKEFLASAIVRVRTIVDNLKNLSGRPEMMPGTLTELSIEPNPQKYIEEEYLKVETTIVATFSIVENMKQMFYAGRENISRGDYSVVSQLFEEIERMREDFESIERPTLNLESPPERETVPSRGTSPKIPIHLQKADFSKSEASDLSKDVRAVSPSGVKPDSKSDQHLDPEAELAMLESEFGKVSGEYSTDEIGGWEFDELEQELKSGSSVDRK